MAVNRFVRTIAPQHPYSTFLLRVGALDVPHRDTKNGPFPTMRVCGYRNPLGDTPMKHLNQTVWGTVVNLKHPFFFNARKTLHAGFVETKEQASTRVIL